VLRRLADLPDGVDGVDAVGTVSKDDYDRFLEPILDAARREGRRIRFLYRVGPEFEGFTVGAAWEDARIGMRFLRVFEGCAVVSDIGWIRHASRFVGTFLPCPVQVFDDGQMRQAVEWLVALPVRDAASHRLVPERGVIVVELRGPLRVRDLDAVAATADSWIESHGDLQGLVVHARGSPGWQDLDNLLRQLRFVSDRHRRVRRLALSTDATPASTTSGVASHFDQAEIRHYAFDALDEATAWAGGPSPGRA